MLQPPGGGTPFAPDIEPVVGRLLVPRAPETAEQIAALFCRSVASPRGWAQVIGNDVLVNDVHDRLDALEALLKRIDTR